MLIAGQTHGICQASMHYTQVLCKAISTCPVCAAGVPPRNVPGAGDAVHCDSGPLSLRRDHATAQQSGRYALTHSACQKTSRLVFISHTHSPENCSWAAMAAIHVFVAALRSVEPPPTILQASVTRPGAPSENCAQIFDKVCTCNSLITTRHLMASSVKSAVILSTTVPASRDIGLLWTPITHGQASSHNFQALHLVGEWAGYAVLAGWLNN